MFLTSIIQRCASLTLLLAYEILDKGLAAANMFSV